MILTFDERGLVRVRLSGSSAYVAPAPLPSSQWIQREPGTASPAAIKSQDEPIWVPGIAPSLIDPVPNLPHGPETFQDRRSRSLFQSGLLVVPIANFSQYMALCTQ